MTATSKPPPDVPVRIRLPARCDLRAAMDLHPRLRAAGPNVAIDAGAVEVLTSPVAQLLVSARASLPGLRFDAVAPAARECLAALGLAHVLEDPA